MSGHFSESRQHKQVETHDGRDWVSREREDQLLGLGGGELHRCKGGGLSRLHEDPAKVDLRLKSSQHWLQEV